MQEWWEGKVKLPMRGGRESLQSHVSLQIPACHRNGMGKMVGHELFLWFVEKVRNIKERTGSGSAQNAVIIDCMEIFPLCTASSLPSGLVLRQS